MGVNPAQKKSRVAFRNHNTKGFFLGYILCRETLSSISVWTPVNRQNFPMLPQRGDNVGKILGEQMLDTSHVEQ